MSESGKPCCLKISSKLKSTSLYLIEDISGTTMPTRWSILPVRYQKRREKFIAYFSGENIICRPMRNYGNALVVRTVPCDFLLVSNLGRDREPVHSSDIQLGTHDANTDGMSDGELNLDSDDGSTILDEVEGSHAGGSGVSSGGGSGRDSNGGSHHGSGIESDDSAHHGAFSRICIGSNPAVTLVAVASALVAAPTTVLTENLASLLEVARALLGWRF